jgi:hypothetical protein
VIPFLDLTIPPVDEREAELTRIAGDVSAFILSSPNPLLAAADLVMTIVDALAELE